MNRFAKTVIVTGTAVLAASAATTYYQYHKMKHLEKKLEALPIHRFKKSIASVHRDEDRTIIEVPKETSFIDRLRMSVHILLP